MIAVLPVKRPVPKSPFGIVGEGFSHRRPIPIVHGPGEEIQCPLDVPLITQRPQID